MRTPRDFLLYQGYEECFREKYDSRRGEVFMGCALNQDCYQIEYILKTSDDPSFEAKMISFFSGSGVKVPRLLAMDEKTIMLEYIRGETISETLETYEKKDLDAVPPILALREWLISYHEAGKSFPDMEITSKGDLSLTNFTYTPAGEVYGYDFEEGDYTGDWIKDLHSAAANILTQEPMFTDYKKNAARVLLGDEYDREQLVEALAKVKKERGLDFSANEIVI